MTNQITMQNVTETADQLGFTFDVFNFPSGIPIVSREVLEPLQSRGVDGTVYRSMGKQFTPFQAIATKYHLTFEAARTYQRDLERCKSNFIKLESDQHGAHEDILCASVSTRIIPCEGVGSLIPTGTHARTDTVFDLVFA